MRKKDVKIGGRYVAKVSGRLVAVRIERQVHSVLSGRASWVATNERTGRDVRIRSGAKLRRVLPSQIHCGHQGCLLSPGHVPGHTDG